MMLSEMQRVNPKALSVPQKAALRALRGGTGCVLPWDLTRLHAWRAVYRDTVRSLVRRGLATVDDESEQVVLTDAGRVAADIARAEHRGGR